MGEISAEARHRGPTTLCVDAPIFKCCLRTSKSTHVMSNHSTPVLVFVDLWV